MLAQKFNISLPSELVKKVDLTAKSEYRNRSEFIKEALRSYLATRQVWNDLFDYGSKVGKKMKISDQNQIAKIVKDFRNEK